MQGPFCRCRFFLLLHGFAGQWTHGCVAEAPMLGSAQSGWSHSRFRAIRLLAVTLLAALGASVVCATGAVATQAPEAVVLTVDGVIGPAAADYVVRGLAAAAERRAAVVVIQIDTPGGLDGSMRDIIRAILASSVPVAAYVAPSGARAASAGTYIVYASHVAAMAPGTNVGAATPVALFGAPPSSPEPPTGKEPSQSTPHDTLTTKAVSDAVAYIQALAQLRGRNADWAEQAVRKAVSLPAEQAAQEHVVDFIANDVVDLLTKADGRTVSLSSTSMRLATLGAPLVRLDPTWRTRLLGLVTNPDIAYLLFLFGVFGIAFEATHPGMAAPGVAGSISLLVGLWGLNFLPINYAAAGLVLLGIGLMIAEAFLPTYGALGVGGVAAFAIGSLMLVDTDTPAFRLSLSVVIAMTLVAVSLFLLVLNLLIRARRQPVVTGEAALVGSAGRVLSWSGANGQVQVLGERWQARAEAPLVSGQPVRVIGRRGLTLMVEPDRASAEAIRKERS
jgi:membrane-bound serine protease (ClpP class)